MDITILFRAIHVFYKHFSTTLSARAEIATTEVCELYERSILNRMWPSFDKEIFRIDILVTAALADKHETNDHNRGEGPTQKPNESDAVAAPAPAGCSTSRGYQGHGVEVSVFA